jgi:tRNA G10  N-methylase Trm11
MFVSDDALKRICVGLLSTTKQITETTVRRAIESATRTVSNFRPNAALTLYKRFNATSVLDPCMGWGGRMFGAIAANIPYIGIDPSSYAISGNQALLDDLNKYTNERPQVELLKGCFEDVISQRQFSVDMILTSPPYFDTEHYSDEPTQSFRRYPTYGAWISGFLRPLIEGAFASLRASGILAININTPMVEVTQKLALKAGLIEITSLNLMLPRAPYLKGPQTDSWEPVLIFRREND